MLTKRKKIIGAILFVTLTSPVLAADYDLVINGGRVIDPETMLDEVLNTVQTD